MKGLRRTWIRLLGLLAGPRREREMREEFASHIDMQTEENLRAGMDPQTARRQARLKFGGIPAVEEAWRAACDGWKKPCATCNWGSVR